jgi:hypothetical protein
MQSKLGLETNGASQETGAVVSLCSICGVSASGVGRGDEPGPFHMLPLCISDSCQRKQVNAVYVVQACQQQGNKLPASTLPSDLLSRQCRVSNVFKFGKDFTGGVFNLITLRQTETFDISISFVYSYILFFCIGRDSLVDKATRCGPDGPGIEFGWGRDFPQPFIPALGPTQPTVQRVPGLFPGVKRPGRGVEHTPSEWS